jgi:hypothetical protein
MQAGWAAREQEIRLASIGGEEASVPGWFSAIRLPVVFAPIVMLAVASCGTESVIAIGAGLASFIHTDQVPTDYVAEYASGKQCNLLKSLEDGGPMCRDFFERRIIEKPIYCYRTIGEPTCYATPDPYGTGAVPIR